MATTPLSITPDEGRHLLWQIRAAFAAQGTSLHRWCKHANLNQTSVRRALLGERNSPMARRLRKRALKAAGINPAEVAA